MITAPTPGEIRALRKARGETQEEFARAVGVRTATISYWELGRHEPQRLARRALRKMMDQLDDQYGNGREQSIADFLRSCST